MIYDHIKNIGLYKGLSEALDAGLDYVATASEGTQAGTYPLAGGAKAIVSEYTTKPVNEKGYEAHRLFADIQFLLAGEELIRCKPLEQVKETIPYNADKDAARYADEPGADMILGGGYFLVVFPDDAHEPGLCVTTPCPVKKVVVKVPVK